MIRTFDRAGRPSFLMERAEILRPGFRGDDADIVRVARAVFEAADGLERMSIREVRLPLYEMRTPGWVPPPEVQAIAQARMPLGCRLEFSAGFTDYGR